MLLAIALCEGCASRYSMYLNNGEVITARGRPKFDHDKGIFIYTDALGNRTNIAGGAVHEVKPASWKSADDKQPIKYLQP